MKKYMSIALFALAFPAAHAQDVTLESEIIACSEISNGLERVQCYDELAGMVKEHGSSSTDPTVEISKKAAASLSSVVDDLAVKVKQNWTAPDSYNKGMKSIVKIAVEPDGTVTSVETIKSSENPDFDMSTVAAVNASSPLPFPNNPEYYPFIREFAFEFEP